MTHDEVREFMADNPATFYKVWATGRPGFSDIVEYRFPGISFTGYLIENTFHILAFIDWLNVSKIEVW